MEIVSQGIADANGKLSQILSTVAGTSDELTLFRDAIDRALHGGPAVFESQSTNGAKFRILVDRLGPPLPTS